MYADQSDMDGESFLLIDASKSVLLFIDLQTKLAPAVDGADACIARCQLLLAAARRLDVPVLVTEHCPERVGPTVPDLASRLAPFEVIEKRHFNGVCEPALGRALAAHDRRTVVVAGMEAHVCVLQTVFGLKGNGFEPMAVADAMGSRFPSSRDLAIARMRQHGVDVVDADMVLFEWLKSADHPAFSEILPMIKSGKVP